jgi:methyl-accepting chemotaxis protein
MSRSIYFELCFILVSVLFIRDIKHLYIATIILLVYSYLKRYIDKRDIMEFVSNWKKYLKQEKYLLKEKKYGSIKMKKLMSIFHHISAKEREKSLEMVVASERMEALKNQLVTIVDNNEESLKGFLRDIRRGIDINSEARDELFLFKDEFEKLIEINKINVVELNQIANDNVVRKQSVEGNIKSIDGGLNDIEELSKKVEGLEGHTPKLLSALEEVKGIVGIVENVAKKTELLSFNASIEASRVGEMGKGFAVVADEIINLANESRGAITDIENYIELLNNELYTFVNVIVEAKQEVDKVKEMSQNISSSLNTLENEFDLIDRDLKNVEKNSNLEKDIFIKVNDNLSKVNEVFVEGERAFAGVQSSIGSQKEDLKLLKGVTVDLENATEDIKELTKDIDLSKLFLTNADTEKKLQEERQALEDYAQQVSVDNYGNLDSYLKKRPQVEAIWINNLNGNFVISIPKAGINNGRSRPWFYETLKKGQYESKVYVSAISKKPCITIARSLYKKDSYGRGGALEVEGVLAVDISLE